MNTMLKNYKLGLKFTVPVSTFIGFSIADTTIDINDSDKKKISGNSRRALIKNGELAIIFQNTITNTIMSKKNCLSKFYGSIFGFLVGVTYPISFPICISYGFELYKIFKKIDEIDFYPEN
jgi:hypothetical protein